MVKRIEDEVAYYYDLYPTEEDLMGESFLHRDLIHYLVEVLRWLFWGQVYAVYGNVNFYQTAYTKEKPLSPDIAVIKGAQVDFHKLNSWRVGTHGPAPCVVVEIASESTWETDLKEKPLKYAQMGVREYFAYDPHEPPLPLSAGRRLRGWHLSQGVRELLPGPDGWLWSSQLESFLGPDGAYLRLYDRSGQIRLTRDDALAEKLRSLGIDPDQI